MSIRRRKVKPKSRPRRPSRPSAGRAARGRPTRAKRATRSAAAGTSARPKRRRAASARARRPALTVVKRAAPGPITPKKPMPEAFAGAKAGATLKELVLFEMERARVAVHAAIQGLGPAAANTPVAPGKWTPRQIVLHLAYWDRESMRLLESAFARGQRATFDHAQLDAINAVAIANLDAHDWDGARRMLQSARADLREAFEAIPDEPEELWSEEHALGALARRIAAHDRHHAERLKHARLAAPTD